MQEVVAHITGTVWKITVAVGDVISDGDELVVIESMKMEMPVESGLDGTVVSILCVEGQTVNEGDVLLTVTSP
jgi:acetyl-CoA carboxylase biotin carboxyl carrier protein